MKFLYVILSSMLFGALLSAAGITLRTTPFEATVILSMFAFTNGVTAKTFFDKK